MAIAVIDMASRKSARMRIPKVMAIGIRQGRFGLVGRTTFS